MKRLAVDAEAEILPQITQISRIVRNVLTSLGNHARVFHGKSLRPSALRQSVKISEICGKNLRSSALRQSVKISEICGKNLRPWHDDLLS